MTTDAASKLLTWSDRYSVGIARIDTEHQKLIGLVNDLYSAMLEGRGKSVIDKVLHGLADYAQSHFVNEERLMRIHAYPGFEAHKAEHEKLTAQVKHLQEEARSGKSVISMEVMRFLQHWLTDHIVGVDKQYSAHLRAAGVK
jgi:hemerythrin